MKKILLLLLCSPLLWAFQCDEDDNPAQDGRMIRGSWYLVNVSGSITGASFDFPPGTIKWTFNTQNQTVTVINNNPTDSNAEDFFETGTYNYQYISNDISIVCNSSLKIDNIDLGCQHIEEETLTLSQAEADGYILTLKR